MKKTSATKAKHAKGHAVDLESQFMTIAREVGDWIAQEFANPIVAHHYDADGIASGALVSLALSRAHVSHTLSTQKKFDLEVAKQLRTNALSGSAPRQIVLVDLGSGQQQIVVNELVDAGLKVAVIDHHAPQELPEPAEPKLYKQVNCCLQGYDGGYSACGASTAYFCFAHQQYNDSTGQKHTNADLGVLGIVGAVGDMQDSSGGFKDLNKIMLDSTVKEGYAVCKQDLRLFGRVSRTLTQFIAYAQEPVIPGLYGDERATARFLASVSIPYSVTMPTITTGNETAERFLRYSELDDSQKKKLASELIAYCLKSGMDESAVKSLIGPAYEFPKQPAGTELSDANEFATLLNACGRHGRADLAISVCRGDFAALEPARALLAQHRQLIAKGIQFAKNHSSDLGAFYLVDGRGAIPDYVIGTVIGSVFASGLLAQTKPIIGLSIDETGQVKASARANKKLVSDGLDLNLVMRTAANQVGGAGGGHNIAAGASVAPGGEAEFLRRVKELVESQLPKEGQHQKGGGQQLSTGSQGEAPPASQN